MSNAERVRVDVRFAIIPEWVLDGTLSTTAVCVYAQLALMADYESGECRPRRRTIADRLSKSPSTVDRALDELVEARAISVEQRFDESGAQRANVYVVHRVPLVTGDEGGPRHRAGGMRASDEGPSSPVTTLERDTENETQMVESTSGAVELTPIGRARLKASESGAADLVDVLAAYLVRDEVRHSITSRWYDDARLLIERDERSVVDALAALRWVFEIEQPRGDWPGWRANVHSPAALRRHFDKIAAQMRRDRQSAEPAGFSTLRREAHRTGATT